ncbi:hypothetical protein P7K49_017951 [Saguinus oedipus]|uniref:Large ribosomal subunit protein uL10 n=1 Tax=Saguinus oedipus TaxID=9490 RepID=A0ABQ9V4N2_SAGOE|nr:hypothetical protein P7K49_017951 [Saguinus oedipus]
MMRREDRATWKSNYFCKIIQLLDDYLKCLIVGAVCVPPKEGHGTDGQEHYDAQGHLGNSPALEKLLPPIRGNMGFAFTKEVLTEIRNLLLANKVPAAACADVIAPCEVTVPAQNTAPHSITSGYKRVLAPSVETDYTFSPAKEVKAFLADPSAFVAAAPVATTTKAAFAAAAAPAKVDVKEESEELDEDMGFCDLD